MQQALQHIQPNATRETLMTMTERTHAHVEREQRIGAMLQSRHLDTRHVTPTGAHVLATAVHARIPSCEGFDLVDTVQSVRDWFKHREMGWLDGPTTNSLTGVPQIIGDMRFHVEAFEVVTVVNDDSESTQRAVDLNYAADLAYLHSRTDGFVETTHIFGRHGDWVVHLTPFGA